ncbi:B3 domain-containing protein Os01g0234100 [Linum perenne]
MTVLQVKKEQNITGKKSKETLNHVLPFTNQESRSLPEIMSTVRSLSQRGKRATLESLYVNSEVEEAVMRKAQEIESLLPRNYPAMIKLMLPSHVTGGFWLGLPKGFSYEHLPNEDTDIDLEDENGEVHTTKYLVNKNGLSAGWRGFSIKHKLLAGDVLVFQLVRPTRFKVHIVRVSGLHEDVLPPGFVQTHSIKEELNSGIQPGDMTSESVSEFDLSAEDALSNDTSSFTALFPQTQQEGGIFPNRSTKSNTRKRVAVESPYVNGEVDNHALLKAQEVKDSLPKSFPSMMRVMLPSHVSGGFSLSLAKGFGPKHLPDKDTEINLEDEDGNIYPTKYLVHKRGLSGGWRSFSIDHKLVCGDVLVFQLVQPTKFKVYIVRASDSDEVDVALGLLQMDSDREKLKSANLPKGYKESIGVGSDLPSNNSSERHKSGNGEEGGFGFDISDGIRMFESAAIDFEQVKSFDDFDIVANGLVINCELSKHLQLKYYELCCSQKLFLHEHILEGLNCKLIVGVIAETINIADAIRDAKFSGDANTQQKEDFVTWENTLVAFQKLGMNVEFILTRLRQLMGLCDGANRHKRLRAERVQVEQEVEILKAKLEEAMERIRRIDGEMEGDDVDVEVKFREVAKAPWSLLTCSGKGSC